MGSYSGVAYTQRWAYARVGTYSGVDHKQVGYYNVVLVTCNPLVQLYIYYVSFSQHLIILIYIYNIN